MERKLSQHILVTGASGYIGRRFVEAAVGAGCQVTSLGRTPVENTRHVPWQIGQMIPSKAFKAGNGLPAVEVIFHLAHQWDSDGGADDVNVTAVDALLTAARQHKVKRFVFASSMSARPNALNRYGRVKWAVEQRLTAPLEITVRIGLVYGGPEEGIWGTVCGLVRNWPVLPMIDPWRQIQPIHVEDLCMGLLAIGCTPGRASSKFVLASALPVSFGRFLKLLARQKFGKRCLIIPVPSLLALPLIKLIGRIPGTPPIDRERVNGLAGARTMPSEKSLDEVGLKLRPLIAGLAGEGADRRRLLIEEGRVMLSSILKGRPPTFLIRRYVRNVEKLSDGSPLTIPFLIKRWPSLIRAVEPVFGGEAADRLRQRIQLAITLVDSSREGAQRLYNYNGASRFISIIGLLGLVMTEIALLVVRLALAKVVWR